MNYIYDKILNNPIMCVCGGIHSYKCKSKLLNSQLINILQIILVKIIKLKLEDFMIKKC